MELIEKLRERADVSYEEAKEILEQTGDDLLEAIVILERQGKLIHQKSASGQVAAAAAEAQAAVSNDTAADPEVSGENVLRFGTADAAASEMTGKTEAETAAHTEAVVPKKEKTGGTVGRILDFLLHTSFRINSKNKEVFAMPTWLFALLLPATWEVVVPAMVIALFFGFRYSFTGKGSNEQVSEFLDKAGSFADGFKSSF